MIEHSEKQSQPLRILVVASARLTVPPTGYGGAERVLAQLCDGFSRRGHKITLMGAKRSTNYGRLVTYPWAGQGPIAWRAFCKFNFITRSMREIFARHDVVLAGCRVDYLLPFLRWGTPIVYRFGNPILLDEVRFLREKSRGPLALISVSDHQRAQYSGPWKTIHNGVDVDRHSTSGASRRDYIAFLGRLTANKGIDVAIRAAQRAGKRLKIAGNIPDERGGRNFFEEQIKPHLGDNIEWIGEIGDTQKVAFLNAAEALLAPIQWDEPCANVVPEALACGTPVITTTRGSMPELIRNGINGFLVDDEEDMVRMLHRISELSHRACRDDAEARFSSDIMVENYLGVLRSLVNGAQTERHAWRFLPSP